MKVTAEGADLRRIRKERGLTLREMAEKVGVSAMHLSDVERGFKGGSPELCDRISEHYGVRFITPRKRAELCMQACDGVPAGMLKRGMLAELLGIGGET